MSAWQIGTEGNAARRWIVWRPRAADGATELLLTASGRIRRFGSHDTAKAAALWANAGIGE